jgi:hypothetical protein
MSSLTSVTCLEDSSDGIFFARPTNIEINEDARTRYASSQKIETLIKELHEKGPLVGMGQIGPSSYSEAPFKLKDKVCDQDIYGWKPGAGRKEHSKNTYLVVLGARKVKEREYVYFTVSDDVTLNTTSYFRKHRSSLTDIRIYVTSHKTFRNHLVDLYPPMPTHEADKKSIFAISPKPSKIPALSSSEQEYMHRLTSISPLDSILDGATVESQCKAIGQEIFDKYKRESGGSSSAGREAVKKICNAILSSSATDKSLRKQYIERAWNGIGDKSWQWLA